jgi:hypothetical protein
MARRSVVLAEAGEAWINNALEAKGDKVAAPRRTVKAFSIHSDLF